VVFSVGAFAVFMYQAFVDTRAVRPALKQAE